MDTQRLLCYGLQSSDEIMFQQIRVDIKDLKYRDLSLRQTQLFAYNLWEKNKNKKNKTCQTNVLISARQVGLISTSPVEIYIWYSTSIVIILLEYLPVTFENLHTPVDEPAYSQKGSSLWQNHTPSGYPWGHLSPQYLVQMLYFQLADGDVYRGNGWLFDADWILISVLQEHPRRK